MMRRDSHMMREGGATLFTAVKHRQGVAEVAELILGAWSGSGADKVASEGR